MRRRIARGVKPNVQKGDRPDVFCGSMDRMASPCYLWEDSSLRPTAFGSEVRI
jgi:hypothetical protein